MPDAVSASDQAHALLLAVLRGDSGLAADLLTTVDCVIATGGLDEEQLRGAGLGTPPPAAAAGVVLRGLAHALLFRNERPRLRRGAYRAAAAAGVDEGAAIATVAAAVLGSDLARGFDLDLALVRCHQTLLEEAPTALLLRLRALEDDAALGGPGDDDPTVALQRAITALHRARGVDAVVALFAPVDGEAAATGTALSLAAGLAALRDGLVGFDTTAVSGHALSEHVARTTAEAVSHLPEPATPLN